MIDREGRVIVGSFLVFVVVSAGSVVLERQTGIALREWPLVAFLLVVGVAIALPQLYLAWTETSATSRTRLRFAAVTTAAFAVVFADDAAGARHLLLAAIGTGALLGLFCYEAFVEYRPVSDDVALDFLDR